MKKIVTFNRLKRNQDSHLQNCVNDLDFIFKSVPVSFRMSGFSKKIMLGVVSGKQLKQKYTTILKSV